MARYAGRSLVGLRFGFTKRDLIRVPSDRATPACTQQTHNAIRSNLPTRNFPNADGSVGVSIPGKLNASTWLRFCPAWAKSVPGSCFGWGPFPIRELRAAKRGIQRLFFVTVSVARGGDQAPFSHFFMKAVFAAPESGLPSWLTAWVEQVSAMHFFTNEVLAAPASGLPSLPTALLSQVSCARAAPPANATTNAANIIFLSMVLSLSMVLE